MSRSAEQQRSGVTKVYVPRGPRYRHNPYNSLKTKVFSGFSPLFMGHSGYKQLFMGQIKFTVLEADLTRHITCVTGLKAPHDFAVMWVLRLNERRSKGSCFVSVHPDHAETLLSLNGRMDLPFVAEGLALVVESRRISEG
jgi:hypothetical protein